MKFVADMVFERHYAGWRAEYSKKSADFYARFSKTGIKKEFHNLKKI